MAVGTLQSVVSAALHHVSRAPGGVQDEAIGKTVKPSLGPPVHFPQCPCPSVYHRQWGRGKRPKGHLMTLAEGSGLLRSQNTHLPGGRVASPYPQHPQRPQAGSFPQDCVYMCVVFPSAHRFCFLCCSHQVHFVRAE